MKIALIKTADGFTLCDEAGQKLHTHLQDGSVYVAEIEPARNYEFHKKYFALIRAAWEMQPEQVQAFFGNSVDTFRKTIENAAGNFELVYDLRSKRWVDVARSISYNSLSKREFDTLFERVKDVILSHFCDEGNQEKMNFINTF